MSRYVIDTCFVSSLFNSEDVNHKKASDIAKVIYSDHLIIPSVVISELSCFTKNTRLKDTILENIFNIVSEIFPLDESNIFEYLSFQENFPNPLTAIDSIILFTSVINDAELLTFDKELKKNFESIK